MSYKANANQISSITQDISSLETNSLNISGGTITGNLGINGNLVVSGDEVIQNVETILIEDNIITLNSGETNNGVLLGESGIEVDRGTWNNYHFKFVENGVTDDGTFVIGISGDFQAVATREDTPTNGRVAIWDSTTNKFVTTGDGYVNGNLQANKIFMIDTYARINLTAPTNGEGAFIDAANVTNTSWADLHCRGENVYISPQNGAVIVGPDSGGSMQVHIGASSGFVGQRVGYSGTGLRSEWFCNLSTGASYLNSYDDSIPQYKPLYLSASTVNIDQGYLIVGGVPTDGQTLIYNTHIELGSGRTADVSNFIDFHTAEASFSDFSARIIREQGANNNFVIVNRGGGGIVLNAFDNAYLQFSTNNLSRLYIDHTGNATFSNQGVFSASYGGWRMDSNAKVLELKGGTAYNDGGMIGLYGNNAGGVGAGGFIQFITNGSERMKIALDGHIYVNNDGLMTFGPNSTWGAYLRVGGNGWLGAGVAQISTTNGNIHIDTASTASNSTYINFYQGKEFFVGAGDSVNVRMHVDSTGKFACLGMYSNTTASGANMFVGSDGAVYRSTSSLRYKYNVEYFVDHSLLNPIKPAFYTSKMNDKQYIGLIAENVAEADIHFAIYDSDNRPEAIEWNAIHAVHIAKTKYLENRIFELEQRIQDLENK